MTSLLDTDHISILQRATGDDFARLQVRLVHQPLTALARDLALLTRNARDFRRVPALHIEDWTV